MMFDACTFPRESQDTESLHVFACFRAFSRNGRHRQTGRKGGDGDTLASAGHLHDDAVNVFIRFILVCVITPLGRTEA